MSIFPKFFFTLFGNAPLPSWLRSYIARVEGDGGTIVDTGHTKEVYADTYPYEPTLIQSCSGGGSTPQNFAVGSEDISNATYWAVSEVTATSDAEPNPFGGSGVSLVAETGATTAKGFFQQSGYQASIVTGQAYTISAYVKKGDGALAPDIIQITYLSGGFGTDFYANYNISTGVVTKVDGGFADIQDVGGGWYRISLAGVAVATGTLGTFVLAFVNNDPNATRLPSYTGNTSRDVYVWGVQFVQGNEPGQYIKTTTAAIDSIGTLYSIIPSIDLLDRYTGAAAAYSLRSLSKSTTNVVKVRRSSDDAELDFTASQVSDGTLANWVGATEDGFVTTWYDQSGNTNNATQATAASQPKIVSSGTLVTENGKAAVLFDGTDDGLNANGFNQGLNDFATFAILNISETDDWCAVANGTSRVNEGGFMIFGESANRYRAVFWTNTVSQNASTSSVTKSGQVLQSIIGDRDNLLSQYLNGTFGSSTDISSFSAVDLVNNGDLTIGYGFAFLNRYCNTPMQEIIIYNSDQSANRKDIEANINAHYNIYP
jgi:hypothetical protein